MSGSELAGGGATLLPTIIRTQGGSGKNYGMPHQARERETIAGKTPSPYRAIAGKPTPQNF